MGMGIGCEFDGLRAAAQRCIQANAAVQCVEIVVDLGKKPQQTCLDAGICFYRLGLWCDMCTAPKELHTLGVLK